MPRPIVVPPARITTTVVAREAGADPALVRYFFADREGLLLALAQRLLGSQSQGASPDPAEALGDHIRSVLRFSIANPNLHCLMLEELAGAGSADVEEQAAAMAGQGQGQGIGLYARILSPETQAVLREVDPLLLQVAVIGLGDAFASAGALLRRLRPESLLPEAGCPTFTGGTANHRTFLYAFLYAKGAWYCADR